MHPDQKPAKRDALSRVFAYSGREDRKVTMIVQRSDGAAGRRRRCHRGIDGGWKSHYGGRASGRWRPI